MQITRILWLVLIGALCVLWGWIVVGPWTPHNPIAMMLVAVLFTVPNVGALWMMYVAIRYEPTPFLFVALAFIPFSFVWYYFERYRKAQHLTRESDSATG